MSESDAISLAINGDPSAFEFLYKQHHPRVLRQCQTALKNTEAAEDLTQDIFIAVYKQIKHFKHKSKFSTWLHKIATSHIISSFRASKARPQITDDFYDSDQSYTYKVDSSQFEHCTIQQAFGLLNDKDRRYLELELQGYKTTEIGKVMGRGKCATLNNLKKIHRTLRTQLA